MNGFGPRGLSSPPRHDEIRPLPGLLRLYLVYLGAALAFFLFLGYFSVLALKELDFDAELAVLLLAPQMAFWLLFAAPAVPGLALTIQRSPRALAYLRFSAWVSLAAAFISGLALAVPGPDFFSTLAALAADGLDYPDWLPDDPEPLTRILALAANLFWAALVALSSAWVFYLARNREVREVLNLPPEEKTAPDLRPSFSYTLPAVFFVLLIYQGLSSLTGVLSLFFGQGRGFLAASGGGGLLAFVFTHLGFYLVMSILPPLAAAFGLGNLGRELRQGRSALPAVFLVIILLCLFSLVSNLVNFSRLPGGLADHWLMIMALGAPLFYLGGSACFLYLIARRRSSLRLKQAGQKPD
ncbi:MAG: hypothetical protein LBP33_04060 [Candidatus Adiutrix sp.]|jgi:hypothetical protein|nr:hypothetical protein [Candidatus Adiutrix sp.]